MLAAILAITSFTIILLFLPAIIELKKPRDAGPRLIIDNSAKIQLSVFDSIINIDDDSNFHLNQESGFLNFIPDLEA